MKCNHNYLLRTETESVSLKGNEIYFESSFYRCSICNDEYETPEQVDANVKAARKVYEDLVHSNDKKN